MQSLWLRAMRQVLENTEDVGERFPEEARRIHYGEVEERGIRGQATREDAEALRDEGIEVVATAAAGGAKGPAQQAARCAVGNAAACRSGELSAGVLLGLAMRRCTSLRISKRCASASALDQRRPTGVRRALARLRARCRADRGPA